MDKSSPPDIPVLDYQPIEPGKGRDSEKRRGRYGCFIILVIIVAFICGLAYYSYKKVTGVILEDNPQVLPSVALSKAEIDQANQKIEKIKKAYAEGGPPLSLTFRDREINALFTLYNQLKDKVFLTIIKDGIKVEFSVPYKEHFLNGSFRGGVEVEQGIIHLELHYFQVGKFVFLQKILQQTSEFIEEEMQKDPEVRKALKTIRRLKIADGMIFLELIPKISAGFAKDYPT